MPEPEPQAAALPWTAAWAAAFAVHVFTASGAALGLLALLAAVAANWALMFALLGAALVVDGIDGTFARYLDVARRLPRWSGETLDLVVDFATYVFVPAYAVAAGGLMPPVVAVPLALLICVTAALYFADRRMKTADNYFRGFPAVWNAPVFYLFLLRPPSWLCAAIIALLAALTFVPVPFVHPFRVRRRRAFNALMIVAWAALATLALIDDLTPPWWVTGALCAIAVYFLGAGLLRRTD
ncbi:MAG TPA: phosphatidylcholine synthase [Xanthobacteraceae bacterium]|nr:phosphatidylcholine synthase [Xanthobacteraceae bacterium]